MKIKVFIVLVCLVLVLALSFSIAAEIQGKQGGLVTRDRTGECCNEDCEFGGSQKRQMGLDCITNMTRDESNRQRTRVKGAS